MVLLSSLSHNASINTPKDNRLNQDAKALPQPQKTLAINPGYFYQDVENTLFNNRLNITQRRGIQTVLEHWQQAGLTDLRGLAYILATAYHETAGTMQPVKEYGSNEYLRLKYDITGNHPDRAKALGNLTPGDGVKYVGRGFILLTGKTRYKQAGKQLGIDLVSHPGQAKDINTAAPILIQGMTQGWLTGKKLSDYLRPGHNQWAEARQVINGTDRAERVATIARQFYQALITATV